MFLDVRGLRYHVRCWGRDGAPKIFMLHGLQDVSASYQFLVDELRGDWQVLAPDWRGFGLTQWAGLDSYWFPDYLADLEALLERVCPDHPARVIGHSMGANISTLYAGIRPRRLRWLVNLEGIGLAPSAPDQAAGRYAQWLDELKQPLRAGRYRSVEQLATVLKRRNPRLPADVAEFVAHAWSRSAADEGGVRLAFDPRHRLVNPVLYRREEAEACWSRIEIPMLLVMGEASKHFQRRLQYLPDERLGQLFRNVRIVTLKDVGHMMHYEDPQAVARAILEFERTCP
ncbi:MAG: alpha/beta hydrolase [Acidobacteriota bacterium]